MTVPLTFPLISIPLTFTVAKTEKVYSYMDDLIDMLNVQDVAGAETIVVLLISLMA